MSASSEKHFINCEECLPVRDFGEGVEGVVCPISGSFKKATDGCKSHGIKLPEPESSIPQRGER